MGNCCRGGASTVVAAGEERRDPPPEKHSDEKGAGGGLRSEVKIRMTKKELEELVGWLNMADSSFEQVMARLVSVITDPRGDGRDDGTAQVARLRQQRSCSWRPSLHSIPEIN